MDKSEQWIRWEPINGLAAKYYIESISDNKDGLQIIMSDAKNENSKLLVSFESSVDIFRSANESCRLSTLSELDRKYGSSFYGNWTFFKITNSLLLEWFSQQTYGIYNESNFIHFSIVAADSIVDVINIGEPKVTFFEK